MLDLTIRNARICDGLGNPIREGSIGIKDGRIEAIGPALPEGRENVDAGGCVLAPGIVDLHTRRRQLEL